MPILGQQKAAIEEVLQAILTATPSKKKRQLAEMFLTLVDREDWPHYYEVSLVLRIKIGCYMEAGHPRASMFEQHQGRRREGEVQGRNGRVYRPGSRVLERDLLQ